MSVILVICLVVASIGLLRLVWGARFKPPSLMILGALVCLLLGLYMASGIVGREFAVTYILLFSSPVALLFLLFDWQRKVDRKGDQREFQKLSLSRAKVLHNIGHLTVVVPMLFAMSILVVAQIANFMTTSVANASAIMIILLPALWAVLAYLYFMVENKKVFVGVAGLVTTGLLVVTYLI